LTGREDRRVEKVLLYVLDEEGIGCIAVFPLAQGMLSEKYLACVTLA
jgi:L-glyceraldehyde 3-phosphate reductase